MSRPSRYPAELRQRAVRMVAEVRPNYDSDWAEVRQAEVNADQRAGGSMRSRPS